MNSQETEIRALLDRVGKLEWHSRFWKIGGLLAMLALAVAFTAGVRAQQVQQNPSQANPLRATAIVSQDFQLRDASGVLRGELSISNGEPKLELFNTAGKVVWSTTPRFAVQSRLN